VIVEQAIKAKTHKIYKEYYNLKNC